MCQPYSKLKLRCAFKADWPDWDIDEDSFKSPNSNITDKAAKGEGGGFDDADPDLKQWWPIPEISIINSQEHLKNDYNY